MSRISVAPDVRALEIPMDAWTKPFWEAAAQERVVMPCCVNCRTYRWPPGPFCPNCSRQEVVWHDAGPGRIYSYTVVAGRVQASEADAGPVVPALIEFPEAGGMRLLAAIVDAPVDRLAVGARVSPAFSQATNGKVPIFRIIQEVGL